ncbi:hypothetical protein ACWGLF_27520 [Streptomyces puniciscabiei]
MAVSVQFAPGPMDGEPGHLTPPVSATNADPREPGDALGGGLRVRVHSAVECSIAWWPSRRTDVPLAVIGCRTLGFAAHPRTGRLTDRYSPATLITAALVAAAAGTVLLVTGMGIPPATALGLALLDAGCFAAQAADLSGIIALDAQWSGGLTGVRPVPVRDGRRPRHRRRPGGR